MRKMKFRQSDGVVIEIEIPEGATPLGFISEETHATQLENETKRSYKRGRQKASTELLTDEEFKTTALTTWGVKPGEGQPGNGRPAADEVTRLQEQWRTQELKPLQDQLTASQTELTQERERQLAAEIVGEARRLKYLDSLTEHPAGQPEKARIVTLFRSQLAYDPETRMHAVRDGEAFAYAPNATRERPYKGATDLLTEFAGDARNSSLISNSRQNVPGPDNGAAGGGGAAGQVTRKDLETGSFDLEKVASGEVKVVG